MTTSDSLRTAFYRFLDQWLHKSIESAGIVIVTRSERAGFEVLYQSRWSARSTWPVAVAAESQYGAIVDGYAVEPLRQSSERLGALLVSRPGSAYTVWQLEQIREAADMAAAVIGSLSPAPAGHEREKVENL